MTRCVMVVVDGAEKLGALTYLQGETEAAPGDGVVIPFGEKTKTGTVTALARSEDETSEEYTNADVVKEVLLAKLKPVQSVTGPRTTPAELANAERLAAEWCVKASCVVARLSPARGGGEKPAKAEDLTLLSHPKWDGWSETVFDAARRRYLLRTPLVPAATLAAAEAFRLAGKGSVLVVCPTNEHVAAVLKELPTGAVRLDTKPRKGAWEAWRQGVLPVAVTTRAGALYTCDTLAGIVLVEDAHPGHVEARAPRTHAASLAVAQAERLDLDLSVVGTHPTACVLEGAVIFPVGGAAGWPATRIMNRLSYPPSDQQVPPDLVTFADQAHRAGTPATFLVEARPATRRCQGCSKVKPCQRCNVSGCVHQDQRPCPCGATGAWWAGWDAQRTRNRFQGRVETITYAGMLQAVNEGKRLGTVVLFDVDPAITRPGLDPEEAAARLVLLAAEAAGEGGRLLVGTTMASEPILQDLVDRNDQAAVAARVLPAAKEAGLPPYRDLHRLVVEKDAAPNTHGWPGTVLGPRRQGDAWHVIVLSDHADRALLQGHVKKVVTRGKAALTRH